MKDPLKEFSKQLRISSDIFMNCFLIGYFIIGLLLSPYKNTWGVSIELGGLLLIVYYCSKLIPGSNLYQYIASLVIGIFAAQFIYQMGGMVEMHIFILLGSALLIIYRNWKLQLPLAIVVILHYSIGGYYRFMNPSENCILQMNYANISILAVHCFFIIIIISFCGLLAHILKTSEDDYVIQDFKKRNAQRIK
jgi:hypothetical protein